MRAFASTLSRVSTDLQAERICSHPASPPLLTELYETPRKRTLNTRVPAHRKHSRVISAGPVVDLSRPAVLLNAEITFPHVLILRLLVLNGSFLFN